MLHSLVSQSASRRLRRPNSRSRLHLESLEPRRLLAVLTVNTLIDEADGDISDGDISLRDALAFASDGTEIRFDDSLDGGRIVLSMGQLVVNNILSIDATSLPTGMTIDASGNDPTPDEAQGDGSRVFFINIGASNELERSTIAGLTITGGDVTGDGGGIGSPGVEASLRIVSSMITGNSATNHAGGVSIMGPNGLEVVTSVITDNSSTNNGGGVRATELKMVDSIVRENHALDGGGIASRSTMLVRSTVTGNTASGFGGGISGRYIELESSTISRNDADVKGGGLNGSEVEIRNSTISGNSAGTDGGGLIGDSILLESVTVTENSAERGGGIFRKADEPYAFAIRNSIIAGNNATEAADLRNVVFLPFEIRSSLIGDNAETGLEEAPVGSPDADGNIVGDATRLGLLEPGLAELASHGGPTETHALTPGSPAIDVGEPAFTTVFDQRGSPFTRGAGRIDMGAFEYQTSPIDFIGDGQVNCSDLDRLSAAIQLGNVPNSDFELTGDSTLDLGDLEVWLRLAGLENLSSHEAFLVGDANLDGRVNAEDLNQVGLNWRLFDRGWCGGDFDVDGVVDGGDLNAIGLSWQLDYSGEEASARNDRLPRAALAERGDSEQGTRFETPIHRRRKDLASAGGVVQNGYVWKSEPRLHRYRQTCRRLTNAEMGPSSSMPSRQHEIIDTALAEWGPPGRAETLQAGWMLVTSMPSPSIGKRA